MEKELLQRYLAEGLSLQKIGRRVNRDPSTVRYWLAKHGLSAVGRGKHVSRGGIERAWLVSQVDSGMSVEAIAQRSGFSPTAVRYWLRRYDLTTDPIGARPSFARRARPAGTRSSSNARGMALPRMSFSPTEFVA